MADNVYVIFAYETRRAAYRVEADDPEGAIRAYVETGSGYYVDSTTFVSERIGEPVEAEDGGAYRVAYAEIHKADRGAVERRHDASEDMLAALKLWLKADEIGIGVDIRDAREKARAAVARAEDRANG